MIAILSLFLPALSASAQIISFGAQKGEIYTQTTDGVAPTTPNDYSVFAFASANSPDDADSITVTDNGSIPMFSSGTTPSSFGAASFYGGSKAAMDNAFTASQNYTFTVSGGNFDGQTASLPVPQDFYPDQIYLTGTGISDAQHLDPNSDYTFTVADNNSNGTGTNVSGGIPSGTYTNFSVFDPSGTTVIYSVDGSSTESSFVASSTFLQTLTSGVDYTGQMTEFNQFVTADAGFSGASGITGFAQFVNFTIEVVPEPSDWALGLVASCLLAASVLRRRLFLR